MLSRRTYSGNGSRDEVMQRYPHYRSVVVVAATTFEPLTVAISKVVPGQVYEHRVKNPTPNARKARQWTFRWNAGQIVEYLPQVLPWLVIKAEQAELVLQAQSLKADYRPGSRDRNETYRMQLEEIYLQIRSLNTRGRTAPGR